MGCDDFGTADHFREPRAIGFDKGWIVGQTATAAKRLVCEAGCVPLHTAIITNVTATIAIIGKAINQIRQAIGIQIAQRQRGGTIAAVYGIETTETAVAIIDMRDDFAEDAFN